MLTRTLVALLFAAIIAPHCLAQSELQEDTDGDGLINLFDNCYVHPNPLQGDADGDGWGNRCDADLDNDFDIDFEDLSLFSKVMFTNSEVADFNEDGVVNFLDLRVFRSLYANGQPGPSIVKRWVGGSGSWNDSENWFPRRPPSPLFETAIINTAKDVIVTIEEGQFGGAKHLLLSGNLKVCGNYATRLSTTVTGTIGTTGCGGGSIVLDGGLDLAGELILDSSLFWVENIREFGDVESSITVTGTVRLYSNIVGADITTEVDIFIKPGAELLVSPKLSLIDASITFQSENDLPAELFISQPILGTGALKFEGPPNESATGVLRTFGVIDIGADIEVNIDPGAYAFLDGQFKNFGRIVVEDSATLFFAKFNLTTNEGQIVCSSNGRIAEFETGFPSPGDSILFNNEGSELVADNCTMDWPTRALNTGVYNITSSQISLPTIGASAIPLNITNTDITIEPSVQVLPGDFYLFDPANENSVALQGFLPLNDETLEIDAARWRFEASPQNRNGALFQSGTLLSETPLNINAGVDVRFEAVVLETEINLEPGANAIVRSGVELNKDIHFLAPENCDSAPGDTTVLRFDEQPLPASAMKIEAESSAAIGDANCLHAEIVTDELVTLAEGINLNVSNAEMKIHAEGNASLTIEGETVVSGSDSILTLQQTANSGTLACLEGATVLMSGTTENPFINTGLINSENCELGFSDSWLNNGEVFTLASNLNFTGPENTEFTPGTGNFVTIQSDIVFDMDISNPSSLNAFKVIPSNIGTFRFTGTVTDPEPVTDLADFPYSVQFGDGFELADTRLTGFGNFQLFGETTLRNVELAANVTVNNNATLNVYEQLNLDDGKLIVLSNSNDGNSVTTRVLLQGLPNITGKGFVIMQTYGPDAISKIIQTVDDTPISIDADINTICVSGGKCSITAGAGSGEINLFGDLFVADETSQLTIESDTTLYRDVVLVRNGQLRVADETSLTFSGPASGIEMRLINEPMGPGITALGSATIDISDASLLFTPGEFYTLANEETVVVLSHEGSAQRIGEFSDVSEAAIDDFLFDADYSSPDVTIFRGPGLEAPNVTR